MSVAGDIKDLYSKFDEMGKSINANHVETLKAINEVVVAVGAMPCKVHNEKFVNVQKQIKGVFKQMGILWSVLIIILGAITAFAITKSIGGNHETVKVEHSNPEGSGGGR